jgi:hypothetical protein
MEQDVYASIVAKLRRARSRRLRQFDGEMATRSDIYAKCDEQRLRKL